MQIHESSILIGHVGVQSITQCEAVIPFRENTPFCLSDVTLKDSHISARPNSVCSTLAVPSSSNRVDNIVMLE